MLGICCLPALVIGVDLTAVAAVLPWVADELGASAGAASWVLAASFLGAALAFAPLAVAASRWGGRRIALAALALWTIAALGAAAAQDPAALALSRAGAGFAVAGVTVGLSAVLRASFTPAEQSPALGVLLGVGGVGFAAGPVLGGLLGEEVTWRVIPLVGLPILVLAAYLLVAVAPTGRAPGDGPTPELVNLARRIAGVVALASGALALVLVLVGLVALGDPPGLDLLVGALGVGTGVWALRGLAPSPLVGGTGALGAALVGASWPLGLVLVVVPGVLWGVTGADGVETGAVLLAATVGFVAGLAGGSAVAGYRGEVVLVGAGAVLSVGGLALVGWLDVGADLVVPVVGLTLAGVGHGVLTASIHGVLSRRSPLGSVMAEVAWWGGVGLSALVGAAVVATVAAGDLEGRLLPPGVGFEPATWDPVRSAVPASPAQLVAAKEVVAGLEPLGPVGPVNRAAAEAAAAGLRAGLAVAAVAVVVAAALALVGMSRRRPGPPDASGPAPE